MPRAGPVVTHLMAKENLWEELGHLQPPYDTLGTNCHEYTCGGRTHLWWDGTHHNARPGTALVKGRLSSADLGSL